MLKYKLKLGSVPVEVHAQKVEGFKWKHFYDTGRIHISDKYEGRDIPPSNYKKYTWEAIHLIIMREILCSESMGEIFQTHQAAQQVLVSQMMLNLWVPNWESLENGMPHSVELGNTWFSIKVANETLKELNKYARCNPNMDEIIISTRNKDGELYSREFILQTLIHELLHGINQMLGLQGTEWDSENVVNTVATFLTEAHLSFEEVGAQASIKDYNYTSFVDPYRDKIGEDFQKKVDKANGITY